MDIPGRFSKASLTTALEAQMASAATRFKLLTGHDIDPQNGTSQAWPKNWHHASRKVFFPGEIEEAGSVEAGAIFGEWKTCQRLLDAIRR